MPSTTYAATRYTDRPDSGAGGNYWALDNATRYAAVTSFGGGSYEGTIADDYGNFVTVPGTAPDGSGQVANVVIGSFNGTAGYSFTATGGSPSASNVPGTAFGGNPSNTTCTATDCPTGSWYELFFPSGTTFGGTGLDGSATGAMGWAWTYSACGGKPATSNTWADTAANGSGSGATDGNITAGC